MKKIAIIASHSYSLINFRYRMLCDMQNSGLTIEAFSPEDSSFKETQRQLHAVNMGLSSVRVTNTRLNPWQDFLFFCDLVRIFKKQKPDYCFSYTVKPVIYGSLAAKFTKIPKIYAMVSGLGTVFINENRSLKHRLLCWTLKKLYQFSLKNIQKVFFHNQDDADLFVKLRLVQSAQVVITDGSGVDITHFQPLPYPQTLTFLFVGRLIRDKGVVEFLQAAEQIKSKFPQIEFLLAGDFHHNPSALSRESLQSYIDRGIVKHFGHVSDVRCVLEQCSVFVLPSYREGLSRASLEALACARPIITTDAPGCREVVQSGVNGILVEPKQVNSLLEAMEKFIENPQLIPKMGLESRRLAESRFSVERINQIILTAMDI